MEVPAGDPKETEPRPAKVWIRAVIFAQRSKYSPGSIEEIAAANGAGK